MSWRQTGFGLSQLVGVVWLLVGLLTNLLLGLVGIPISRLLVARNLPLEVLELSVLWARVVS